MLASTLAESEQLRVVESARVFELLRDLSLDPDHLAEADLRQIAELLHVDRLAVGRLRASGGTVRLEGEVFGTGAGGRRRLLFAEEAPVERMFALTGRLAATLLGELRVTPVARQQLPSASPAAMAAYGRGRELLLRGDALAAIPELQTAVTTDAGFTEAWVRLARALSDAGREDEAAAAARRAVESLGTRTGGRLELEVRAEEATRRGELAEAQRTLEELVRQFPNDVESRVALAESYAAEGDLERASRELERAVQLDPNDGRAWYLLGRTSILAGDPRRAAEEHLVRALVLFNKQRNEQGQSDVHNAMGVAQEGLGRLDEAVGSYEQAAAMRRRLGDRRGLAATLLNLGMVDTTRGDLAAARSRFDEALALHGELDDPAGASEAHNSLGLLAEEGGDYPGALEQYRQALQLRKELGDDRALAQSYGNVGYAYYLLGRYDDALLYGRQALELYRESGDRLGAVQAAQTVGACQLDHGALDEATRTFLDSLRESRALEDKPTQAVAHGFLGRVAQAQGRYAAALASYRAALAPLAELEDRRGLVEFTLHEADTLLDLGLDGEARARLDRVAAWIAAGASHEQRALHALLRGVWASRREPGAAAGLFAEARREALASHSPALELRVRLAAAGQAGSAAAAREVAAVRDEAAALGHAPLRLRSAERLAALQLAGGDTAGAVETLRGALALAAKGGSYARSFRLHEMLAEALDRRGETEEAATALAAARAERARIAQGLDPAQRASLEAFAPAPPAPAPSR